MAARALVLSLAALGTLVAGCGGEPSNEHRLTFATGSGGGGTEFGTGKAGAGTQFGVGAAAGGTLFGQGSGPGGTSFGTGSGPGGMSFGTGTGGAAGAGTGTGVLRPATCAGLCVFAVQCGANLSQADCESLCPTATSQAQRTCAAGAADCEALTACLR